MGHTPGPWKMGFNDKSGMGEIDCDFPREGAWIVACDVPETVIVRGGSHGGLPYGIENNANARLIAAAPEYHDIARLTVRVLTDHINHKPVEMCVFAELLEYWNQAIAKVEGK